MSSELLEFKDLKVEGGHYSIEKKIEVVQKYLLLGNLRLVSELTNIDYDVLLNWKKQKWWYDFVEEIKKTREAKTNYQLNKLIDTSLEVSADRLQNGDWIYDQKIGELRRKPVSLKDAATLSKDFLKIQHEKEKLEKLHPVEGDTIDNTLKILAKEFSKWAKTKKTGEIVDIDAKEVEEDALHEEREEGLQT